MKLYEKLGLKDGAKIKMLKSFPAVGLFAGKIYYVDTDAPSNTEQWIFVDDRRPRSACGSSIKEGDFEVVA